MSSVTRRIGLSLGADICWPICYEEILKRLDLNLSIGKDSVRFEVERVTIEPYSLSGPGRYDLVVDRLTHWYHVSREWIKKSVLTDDLYVFNNPWSIQANEKHTSYAAMMALGFPIPETWMVPPKEYEPKADLKVTLESYARMFDLGEVGRQIGYPQFMKPYDGGGWVGVSKITDEESLRAAYEASGRHIMHLQKAVDPFDLFVRVIGFGPQTCFIKYDASKPLHDRYTMEENFLTPADQELLSDMTLTINAFFGWDFNSCEVLRQDKQWFPIDFANACPDSQVTSLHYHFPWLVVSNLKWSIFVAATQRKMRKNLDWEPFYAIARTDAPFRDKLRQYAAIARKHFDVERFQEFCDRHLPHLEETAWEFFASDAAREAVRQKTAALYPPDEVAQFTDLFFGRIQVWREKNFDRIQREKADAMNRVLGTKPKAALAVSLKTPDARATKAIKAVAPKAVKAVAPKTIKAVPPRLATPPRQATPPKKITPTRKGRA